MLYLAVGVGLGPAGLALLSPNPLLHSHALQRAAEVVVLISLFAVGLKLGLPLSDKRWRLPLRLASLSMLVTIALVSVIGVVGLDLSWGAAILLAAIVAPTDPVLAYGIALLCGTYDFLAVLAAGITLQRANQHTDVVSSQVPHVTILDSPGTGEKLATDARYATVYMMQKVRDFNDQLERIAEVAVALVVGAMLYDLTLALVATSVVLHGISVTPLMNLYARRKARDRVGPRS